MFPSSRGLGHRVLIPATRVRIPLGMPSAARGGKIRALLLRRSVTDHAVRSLACSYAKPEFFTPIAADVPMAAKMNFPVHSLTHGGKSKFSPRAPCAWLFPKNNAHSPWLAKHIVQCTGCGQGNTDLYGLVRTCTDPPSPEASEGKQHRAMWGLCAPEIQKRRAQKWGRTSLCFSNTRGEALRCRARRGLGRESLHRGAATAPKILGAAEWHRAFKPYRFPPGRETVRAR